MVPPQSSGAYNHKAAPFIKPVSLFVPQAGACPDSLPSVPLATNSRSISPTYTTPCGTAAPVMLCISRPDNVSTTSTVLLPRAAPMTRLRFASRVKWSMRSPTSAKECLRREAAALAQVGSACLVIVERIRKSTASPGMCRAVWPEQYPRHRSGSSAQWNQFRRGSEQHPRLIGSPKKFLQLLREERTSASSRRLLNSVLGPAVAASPIGAFWAGFPFGVVDTLFVWTANNAVRNDNRFDSV